MKYLCDLIAVVVMGTNKAKDSDAIVVDDHVLYTRIPRLETSKYAQESWNKLRKRSKSKTKIRIYLTP